MARQGPYDSTSPRNELSYLNSYDNATVLRHISNRDPNVNDRRFKIGTDWINRLTNNVWKLTSVVSNQANWEPLSQSAGGNAPISLFVVASDGTGDYTTIQAAITAAAGSDANIWVRPGTYTEDLVITDGISIVGASGSFGAANVTIAGTHTPPASGEISFQDVTMTDATAIVSSAAAGSTTITFQNCSIGVTGGFCCTLLNWTGLMQWQNCGFTGTNDGVTNNTGGSNQNVLNSDMGTGSVNTWVVSGNLSLDSSRVFCPINFVTGSTGNQILSASVLDPVTFSNDSAGTIYNTSFVTGANAAITMSSSGDWDLSNLVIDSTANPAVAGAGAGTLTLTSVDFPSTTGSIAPIANTLTLSGGPTSVASLDSRGNIITSQGAIIASNIDITFNQSPNTCTAANTGGVATGTTGAVNLLTFQEGNIMEQFIIGAGQTIIKPVVDNSGLLCSLDLTATEGAEYNFGAARTNSPFAFTVGTSAAFFFELTMTVADISGGNPYIMGFRKVEANNGTFSAYTDFYALGMITGTSATNVSLASNLNGAGATLQDSGTAWTGGDGGTVTLRVNVSAAGVVTATIDGGAPSSPLAFTFDATDVVVPYIHLVHGASAPGTVHLVNMLVGFQ